MSAAPKGRGIFKDQRCEQEGLVVARWRTKTDLHHNVIRLVHAVTERRPWTPLARVAQVPI